MAIEVYGHSDDIVVVSGGGFGEEFYPSFGQPSEARYLSFSDGTLLQITYDGCWRIAAIAGDPETYRITNVADPDGDYSDRVELSGDIKWAVFGDAMARKSTRGRA